MVENFIDGLSMKMNSNVVGVDGLDVFFYGFFCCVFGKDVQVVRIVTIVEYGCFL